MRAVKKQSVWRLGAIGLSAVSGIEVALWDILGKHLGVPVWRLLGGKVRDRVRVYTHLGLGDMRAVSETTDTAPLVTGVQGGGARLQASSELSSAVKRTSPAPRVLTGRHRLDQHET